MGVPRLSPRTPRARGWFMLQLQTRKAGTVSTVPSGEGKASVPFAKQEGETEGSQAHPDGERV